jgi:hypothetical protein
MALFVVAAIVRGIWREDDEAAVHREGLELDAKSRAFFVREGGADLGPALLGLAVSLVFLDGEDVEVGGRGRRWRESLLAVDLGLIAIVHLRTPDLSD